MALRKRIRWVGLIAALLVLLPSAIVNTPRAVHAATTNMVGNPGFETSALQWSGGTVPLTTGNWMMVHPGASQTSSPVHNGTQAASTYGSPLGGAYFSQDFQNFPFNQSYSLSLWVYPQQGTQYFEFVTGWDRGAGSTTGQISISLSPTSTLFSDWNGVTATVPALGYGQWHQITIVENVCNQQHSWAIDGGQPVITTTSVPAPQLGTLIFGQTAGSPTETDQFYWDDFSLQTSPCATASQQSFSVAGTGGWAPIAPMPTPRGGLAAAAGGDGRVYAIGGVSDSGGALTTVEAYSPGTNSWATAAPMPTPRTNLGAAEGPDGRIYAIGGYGPCVGCAIYPQNTLEAYTPSTNTWTELAPMLDGQWNLAATAGPDGRIYAIGGYSPPSGGAYPHVEAYTPSTNSWAELAPLPYGTAELAAATGSDGRIYAMGGWTGTEESTAFAYTPSANTWSQVASMSVPRLGLSAATGADGRVYAIGGYCEGDRVPTAGNPAQCYLGTGFTNVPNLNLSSAEAFGASASGGSWAPVAPMSTPRHYFGATSGSDGRIYAIGGAAPFCGPPTDCSVYQGALASAEVYTPSSASIKQFTLPTSLNGPYSVVNGRAPDDFSSAPWGAWFMADPPGANQIAVMGPDGSYQAYPTPTSTVAGLGTPERMVNGPDGNIWFTDVSGNEVDRITPAGLVTAFPVLSNGQCAAGPCNVGSIASGPDGNLWFTEPNANNLGRISTSGAVSEFPAGPDPEGIATGADGNLWYTSFVGNTIGRMTSSGAVTGSFPMPAGGAGLSDIASGPDGNLWFVEGQLMKVGRMTVSGSLSESAAPGVSVASGLLAGPDGNMWLTEPKTNAIGILSMTGSLNELPLPTPSASPAGITVGSDGNVWVTEYSGGHLDVITPPRSPIRTQSIRFTSAVPTGALYGGSYTPSATASSGLPVTFSLDSKSSGCTFSGGTATFTGVGTCIIDANQAGNASFSAAPQMQQSVPIAPAPLAIAGSSAIITYGDAIPAITPIYAGFVNGDDASKLSPGPTCSTTATATSPAATYPTTCNGAADPNYTISYPAGSLTVVKKAATLGFTGGLFFSTGSSSATSATVALQGQLTSAAGGNPDLTKAHPVFNLYKSSNLTMATPDLTCNASVASTGVVTCSITALAVDNWTVVLQLPSTDGFFAAANADAVVLTVYQPTSGTFATGGGWIVDPSFHNIPVAISSQNNHGNLGFNVRYKSGTTTPQGQAVYTFRGADGYDYVIKSNSWQGGGASFASSTTSFSGKANVTVIDPTTGLAVSGLGGGNYTFRIDATQTSHGGRFAISVYDATGTLYHQAGATNAQITLGGGSIVLHQ